MAVVGGITVSETLLAMQLQAVEIDRIIQESADFEFAFQMQLVEALRASVSGALSSTASADDNDSDDEMSDGEKSGRGAVAVVPDDRQIAMTEQKQEMDKLNQEMEDEAEALKEQSRLAEIEAISKHDARFARFLSEIPNTEWTNREESLMDPFIYTPDHTCFGGTGKATVGSPRAMSGMVVGSASTSVRCQSDIWEPAVAAAHLLDANHPDSKSYLATMREGFRHEQKSSADKRHGGTSEGDRSCRCGICMEVVMSGHNSWTVSDDCMHRFCTNCLQNYAETAVKRGKSYITCPGIYCEQLLPAKIWERLLSSASQLILTQRQIEDAFPEAERIYCPYQDCSALQLKPELPTQPSTSGHPHQTAVGGVECFSCFRYFCLECQVRWHSDLTCEEFQNLSIDERSAEDLFFKSLVKQKKWQRCKRCGHTVELQSGCHHITCRCGNDFCYSCGDHWVSGHLCTE